MLLLRSYICISICAFVCIKISCANKVASVSLEIDDFGSYTDTTGKTQKVKRFSWSNCNNVTVQIINYGVTITSIRVPSKDGKVEDIVAGFDTIREYRESVNPHFGATIGRVANRIAKGTMIVEGIKYNLAINDPPNHLHGGIQGFDKVMWNYYVKGQQVIFTYHSADMEEGYPGDVIATVTYELTHTNELKINYRATVSKACPINLTNHFYFNLAGHGTGSNELYKHEITINADKYTAVDNTSIPTGKLPDVTGTAFDLRVAKVLGDVITKVPNSPGYDHNFCITPQGLKFAAKAYHPSSGRIMEVYSNQPGVQFYTGNSLPQDNSSQGKGATYKKHGLMCFETQNYPDAVNHPNFPKVIIYPGEEYHHFTIYKFRLHQ